METARPKSVYHTAAGDGVVMGLFMLAAFLLSAISLSLPILSMFSIVMIVLVPVLAYWLMRRGYYNNVGDQIFSALWMHGITIFIFGSLILGLGQYVYTRFIVPDFIATIAQNAVDVYLSMPGEKYQHFGHTLQNIIDLHLLPTPIGFAFSVIWMVSFIGAFLSLFLALIIKIGHKRSE